MKKKTHSQLLPFSEKTRTAETDCPFLFVLLFDFYALNRRPRTINVACAGSRVGCDLEVIGSAGGKTCFGVAYRRVTFEGGNFAVLAGFGRCHVDNVTGSAGLFVPFEDGFLCTGGG